VNTALKATANTC